MADQSAILLKFVHELLVEQEYQRVTNASLRQQLIEIRKSQALDIQDQVKSAVRQNIWRLENSRPTDSIDLLKKQPQAVLSNLPCVLYVLGCEVPLPTSANDDKWSETWVVWLGENTSTAASLLRHCAIEQNGDVAIHADMPSVKDTFEAKKMIKMRILPTFTRFWWDQLRIWAELPAWEQAPNKIYT